MDSKIPAWRDEAAAVAETSPFLFDIGGFFSREPPARGIYLDLFKKGVFSNPGNVPLLAAPWVGESEGRHLRFFSTSLSRKAGGRTAWENEPPLRLSRLVLKIRKKYPDLRFDGGALVDIERFVLQTKILSLTDISNSGRGQVSIRHFAGNGGKAIFFLPNGVELSLKHFAGEEFSFSAGMESGAGPHGRTGRPVQNGEAPPFCVDREAGVVVSPDKRILALNLPRNPKGGAYTHTNWSLYPGPNLDGPVNEAIRQNTQPWSRPLLNVGGGAAAPELVSALVECWNCLCHSRGPTGAGVMRARAKMFGGAGCAIIETRGRRVGEGGWSEARKSELRELLTLSSALGGGQDHHGFSKLVREVEKKEGKGRAKGIGSPEVGRSGRGAAGNGRGI